MDCIIQVMCVLLRWCDGLRLSRTFWRPVSSVLALTCWLAVVTQAAVPLQTVSPTVYQTEHCLFIVDATVPWSNPTNAFNTIYTYDQAAGNFTKLNSYFDTLVAQCPSTYFSVCYLANTGASNVPNYIDRIFKATGIVTPGTPGAPQSFASVDICRYNLPGGNVSGAVLAVYDHEIGHAWGARVLAPTLSNGHWQPNSTVDCQLGSHDTDDGSLTVKKIYGDPVSGFRWQRVDNRRSNDYDTFSEQQLYLMGLRAQWPNSYVLSNNVYTAGGNLSYSAVTTFDQAALIAHDGVRNPDYTTAQKRFKLGFVYIARDVAEVNTVYQAVEQSAAHFCNAEAIVPGPYLSQTSFLCESRFAASADSLLVDLDGNVTPTIAVSTSYVQSTDGSATISFTAADPDGPAPTVSVVPASSLVTVQSSTVQLAGLPDGVFFYTLKAVDAGGKKTFGHFVVEVHRPAGGPVITAPPIAQTATAGTSASFTVAATGGVTGYQWFHQSARTSTWEPLTAGGAYSGVTTTTLTVASTPAMDKDAFLCVVANATSSTTSASATLTVDETTPLLSTQPVDHDVRAPNAVSFTVAADLTTTYGYFHYQWQRLPAGAATWLDLTNNGTYTGTTTQSLNFISAAVMSGDQFRCLVKNTAGTVTSNVAALTVGTNPVVTVQPVSPITVAAGQTAAFTITATGTPPLVYQWFQFSTPIAGATSPTVNFTNVQASGSGYTVTVTNAYGFTRSYSASFNVTPALPSISVQPQAATITQGQGVNFSVTASGTEPLAYQWLKNGSPIVGAIGSSYSIPVTTLAAAANYSVQISNSVGNASSAVATLVVQTPFAAWQASQFTPSELADSNISGSTALNAHNGLANLLVYALGIDPTQAAGPNQLPSCHTTATTLLYDYKRPSAATDVIYAVEASTDLVTWSTNGVTHNQISVVGGIESWEASTTLNPPLPVFMRLRVEKP